MMNTEQIINREQAIDILERFDFFGGQRAGRELWNDKPFDVQEQDITNFSRDVNLLKSYIKEQQAEIERLRAEGKWLNAYEYAIKLGETNKYRLGIAEHDKIWHFCSLCEQQVRFKRNYCPNCGAKMKGE